MLLSRENRLCQGQNLGMFRAGRMFKGLAAAEVLFEVGVLWVGASDGTRRRKTFL